MVSYILSTFNKFFGSPQPEPQPEPLDPKSLPKLPLKWNALADPERKLPVFTPDHPFDKYTDFGDLLARGYKWGIVDKNTKDDLLNKFTAAFQTSQADQQAQRINELIPEHKRITALVDAKNLEIEAKSMLDSAAKAKDKAKRDKENKDFAENFHDWVAVGSPSNHTRYRYPLHPTQREGN